MGGHKTFKFDSSYLRMEVYKKTSDDWYPPYRIENQYQVGDTLVKVTTCAMIEGDYLVSVWGADDCGMNCAVSTPEDAVKLFHNVVQLRDVTMNALDNLGFVSF